MRHPKKNHVRILKTEKIRGSDVTVAVYVKIVGGKENPQLKEK